MRAVMAMLMLLAALHDVRRPGAIRWGASPEEMARVLAGLCVRIRDRPIDPPFLANVLRQRQLDCYSFPFLGRGRYVEFVFGDNRLEMVWIMVDAAERPAILGAMRAAYGAPSHSRRGFVAFVRYRTAWRDEPAEMLFYSPAQAGDWLAWFEGER